MTSHEGSSRPRPRARRGPLGLVLVLALMGALLLALTPAPPAGAADATPQTVPIPASGGTATFNFSGTVPPQVNPTSNCSSLHLTMTDDQDDHFVYTGSVPTGNQVTSTYRITWTPTSPNIVTSDLILTVERPTGQSQSSDGGSNTETVVLQKTGPNAQPYHALVCGFSNTVSQPYTGTLTVTTQPIGADPVVPAAPANGLEFSAAVQADQQRDEAEPLIEINNAGFIYTCGPTGFSNAADYAQVSTDGGDSFHLLGTPPRGQQAGGGGGDCGMAHGLTRNPLGNYQYAYTGLGPLTGFATATSPNNAHNLYTAGPDENGLPGLTPTGGGGTGGVEIEPGFLVDRQWQVFVDPAKNPTACAGAASAPANSRGCVLLSYNRLAPRNTVVQHSVNGGFSYSATVRNAAQDTDFPGPMRYDQARNVVAFPWSFDGNKVRLSISKDGGITWTNCHAATAPGQIPPFVIGDFDSAGNFYIVYSEKAKFHAYMVALPANKISNCNDPITQTDMVPSPATTGFTTPVQVDRGNVKTAVFPWIAAGGAPGRVAVAFAGSLQDGDPAIGCPSGTTTANQLVEFCASWDIYVNQSLNALLGASTAFSQVKATTHPFHFDSICLNGLACDLSIPPGDRSMADFFSIDFNPVSKRLHVTFNRTEKKPGDAAGHVANPMVFTQIAGPTNAGTTLTRDASRQALRTWSPDPGGDALSSYSFLSPGPPTPADPIHGLPPTENERGSDFLWVTVAPQHSLNYPYPAVTTNAGFTVKMGIQNLTSTALQNTLSRTGAKSLLWIFRFTNGWQEAAAVAHYSKALDNPLDGTPADGFRFGFNSYRTGVVPCLGGINPVGVDPASLSEKCVVYPADEAVLPGRVALNRDTDFGIIMMSVPRNLLKGLGPNDPFGRPTQVPATTGTRFYDAVAWSLANNLVTVPGQQNVQSFLYPLDNTPAFDFTLGSGALPSPKPPPLDPLVGLMKSGPATAKRLETVTYTITYGNSGPNPASNARIIDVLPGELNYVSAAGGNSRTYDPTSRKVTWHLGTVPVGAIKSVTLTAKVSSTAAVGAPVLNQAEFTADATVSLRAAWSTTVVP